jgi:hypothetical protein
MRNENPTTTIYSEEDLLALMMDALDGTLSESDEQVLSTQLIHHPQLAQEWEAMQMIDGLFTSAPMIAAPRNFAAETIALLPNLAMRRTVSAALFTVLFIGGLLPFLFVVGLGLVVLGQGTAVYTLLDIISNFGQFSVVLLGAFGQLLIGLGDFMSQNPAVMGTLMVMIGFIFLWTGVYRRLVTVPQVA